LIDPNQLVNTLLSLSGTFAALCIPATSVAYFVVANIDDEAEQKRIASIISMSAFAGIVFVITVFLSLGVVLANVCQDYYWLALLGFCLGCAMIIGVFLKIAGVRMTRKITLPSRKKDARKPQQ